MVKTQIIIHEQLTKSLLNKHPWVYRNKFQPYSKGLADGCLVQLLRKNKEPIGIGVYANSGLVAVRLFTFTDNFSKNTIRVLVENAIQKRLPLLDQTNSLRLVHGENDLLPGITLDYHAGILVLMVYSPSLKVIGRYISQLAYSYITENKFFKHKVTAILFRSPKRLGKDNQTEIQRTLRGVVPERIKIRYRTIHYTIDPNTGKTGIYNDIRNLRNYILDNQNLFHEAIVLNLFSNNGLLSECFSRAGATKVYSVENSNTMLAIHRENIQDMETENQVLIREDIFKESKAILENCNTSFDSIVIDPPSLTSKEEDKPKARLLYQKLISATLPYLKDGGILVLCSCSNRIHEEDFARLSIEMFKHNNKKYKLLSRLKNEIDHPILDTFPEGNYFKVHIYKVFQ
jgi:23S rRNA (cytosine1962-C5)-methyltransferase